MTPRDRATAAADSLRAAQEWRGKGDARWELTCLSRALVASLSAAVGQALNEEDGAAYLSDWGAHAVVRRMAGLITLAGALQAGDNLGPALELAAASVRRRNTDRRVTDWEMIDGDGAYPVRWDFREGSVTKLVSHHPRRRRMTAR